MTKKEGTFDKDLIRELAELLDEDRPHRNRDRARGQARPRGEDRHDRRERHIAVDAGRAAREPGERGGKEELHHPGTVHSPMVGTAYRSPEPGIAPFVEVGARVTARPDDPHHRSHEDHEPHPRPLCRHRARRPRRRRSARRICRAACRHREGLSASRHVRQDPDRQPGRDRASHRTCLQGAWHRHRRGALHGRRRRNACAACR